MESENLTELIEQLLGDYMGTEIENISDLTDTLLDNGIDISSLSDSQLETLFSHFEGMESMMSELTELDADSILEVLCDISESLADIKFNMDATSNNSSYQEVVNCRAGNYDSGRAFSATFTYLIDITNTSTHKVRFGTTTAGSNRVQLDGNGANTILDGTYFVFKKVGET